MSILFYPWHTFFDVKKSTEKSWSKNFEQLYPLLSTFDKEIIKNINISYECKESRDADRLMHASENDNNEQTNCDKHEYSTMDGLYDENIEDEEDHIFYEPIEIHDNTNIEQTFTTSSLLQLEAKYFTFNSMKTNYVIDACDLLSSMHTSKDFTNKYEKETNPFGFSNSSESKNLLKALKALNKKQTCTKTHQGLNSSPAFQVTCNQCTPKEISELRQSDNIQQCDDHSCNTNSSSYIQKESSTKAFQDLKN
jgi:hypothetical protein